MFEAEDKSGFCPACGQRIPPQPPPPPQPDFDRPPDPREIDPCPIMPAKLKILAEKKSI